MPNSHRTHAVDPYRFTQPPLSDDERRVRIRERAYELAAARDFAPGHDLNDWLQAEAEIDSGYSPVRH